MSERGYLRALREYLRTPKGAFDARDYLRAVALIAATIVACTVIAYLLIEE